MSKCLQAGAPRRIRKNELCQRRTIQRAVSVEDVRAERLRNVVQRGRTGCDDLPGNLVCICDGGMAAGKNIRHRRLTGTDSAADADT